jgi:hypothetical protein
MFNPQARLYKLHQILGRDAQLRPPPPVTVPATTAAVAPIPRRRFTPTGPLALTDEQLAAVMQAAEPLAVGDRDGFLRDVAAALHGQQELGDGTVYRTIAQVQRRYYDPPILSAPPRWGR